MTFLKLLDLEFESENTPKNPKINGRCSDFSLQKDKRALSGLGIVLPELQGGSHWNLG